MSLRQGKCSLGPMNNSCRAKSSAQGKDSTLRVSSLTSSLRCYRGFGVSMSFLENPQGNATSLSPSRRGEIVFYSISPACSSITWSCVAAWPRCKRSVSAPVSCPCNLSEPPMQPTKLPLTTPNVPTSINAIAAAKILQRFNRQ
jgi:hypothetical protein